MQKAPSTMYGREGRRGCQLRGVKCVGGDVEDIEKHLRPAKKIKIKREREDRLTNIKAGSLAHST